MKEDIDPELIRKFNQDYHSDGVYQPTQPVTTAREVLLDEARAVVTRSRTQQYAPPDQDFKNIARIWSVILGMPISASQIALCMVGLKMARLINNPSHMDSMVDIAGYAACMFEVSQNNRLEEG